MDSPDWKADSERLHRRDEVGDPAGEEDGGVGPAGRDAGIHSHVVERHKDHHRAAHDVDAGDARRLWILPTGWRVIAPDLYSHPLPPSPARPGATTFLLTRSGPLAISVPQPISPAFSPVRESQGPVPRPQLH